MNRCVLISFQPPDSKFSPEKRKAQRSCDKFSTLMVKRRRKLITNSWLKPLATFESPHFFYTFISASGQDGCNIARYQNKHSAHVLPPRVPHQLKPREYCSSDLTHGIKRNYSDSVLYIFQSNHVMTLQVFSMELNSPPASTSDMAQKNSGSLLLITEQLQHWRCENVGP